MLIDVGGDLIGLSFCAIADPVRAGPRTKSSPRAQPTPNTTNL
jgi:hypothetical protein